MKVTLESTTRIITVNGIEMRVWEGETANGVKCHAYIPRIACEHTADSQEFDRDLLEYAAPSPEIAALPLRMIL